MKRTDQRTNLPSSIVLIAGLLFVQLACGPVDDGDLLAADSNGIESVSMAAAKQTDSPQAGEGSAAARQKGTTGSRDLDCALEYLGCHIGCNLKYGGNPLEGIAGNSDLVTICQQACANARSRCEQRPF